MPRTASATELWRRRARTRSRPCRARARRSFAYGLSAKEGSSVGPILGIASRSLPGSVAGVNNADDYRQRLWVTSQSPQNAVLMLAKRAEDPLKCQLPNPQQLVRLKT